jgi:hypothetical protein
MPENEKENNTQNKLGQVDIKKPDIGFGKEAQYSKLIFKHTLKNNPLATTPPVVHSLRLKQKKPRLEALW